VQKSTLRAHETCRNFSLKCWGLWLSPAFDVRYIPLHCPATVCQHTWGTLALVPLFHSHNVLVKSFTVFVTDFAKIFCEKIRNVTPDSGVPRGRGVGVFKPPPTPPKFRRYRWSPRSHKQEEPASRFPFVVHCVLIRL